MAFDRENALPGLIRGHDVGGVTSASAKPGLDGCSFLMLRSLTIVASFHYSNSNSFSQAEA